MRFLLLSLLSFLTLTRAVVVENVPLNGVPGFTCTDTDSGSGTSHAEAGGRTFHCDIDDPSQFLSIEWNLVNAAMAMDGSFDDNDPQGEDLVPNDLSSCIPGGYLWCPGRIRIFDFNGNPALRITRLRVTFESEGSVIPFTPANAQSVSMDLLNKNDFQVTFFFEVNTPGTNIWEPALEFYEDYPTDPNANGDVLTSFTQGITFEMEDTGAVCDVLLPVLQQQVVDGFSEIRNAHISQQTILNFLQADWNPKFSSVLGWLSMMDNRLTNEILTELQDGGTLMNRLQEVLNHVGDGGTLMNRLQDLMDHMDYNGPIMDSLQEILNKLNENNNGGGDEMLPIQMLLCIMFGPVEVDLGSIGGPPDFNLCHFQSNNIPFDIINAVGPKYTMFDIANRIDELLASQLDLDVQVIKRNGPKTVLVLVTVGGEATDLVDKTNDLAITLLDSNALEEVAANVLSIKKVGTGKYVVKLSVDQNLREEQLFFVKASINNAEQTVMVKI